MTFPEFLKSKQTLLILWFLVHGFALFVNVSKIEGDISSNHDTSDRKDYTTTNLFTTTLGGLHYSYDRKPSSEFWPFVKFYKSNKTYNPYMKREEDFSSFKGCFYQYDFSEFIAYTVLMLIALYFIWSSKSQQKK